MRQLNPIGGFGPIGWIGAVVFSGILVAALAGFDFQYHFIWLMNDLFGQTGLWWYFNQVHVWHGYLIFNPIFGLITAMVAIIAIFVSPSANRCWWKYFLIIVWGLVQPSLWIREYHWVLPVYAGGFGLGGAMTLPVAWFLTNCITCFLLFLLTRSWWVFVITGVATSVVSFVAYERNLNSPPNFWYGPAGGLMDYALGPFWIIAICSSLILWSIHSWRSMTRPGFCSLCGYDLRATTFKRCPECGNSQSKSEPAMDSR